MQSSNTRSQPAETVLAAATAQLATDPAAALAVAEDLLASAPDLLPAQLLAGQALRQLGQFDAAVARLSALAALAPAVPAVRWELAQAAAAACQQLRGQQIGRAGQQIFGHSKGGSGIGRQLRCCGGQHCLRWL